MKIEKELLTNTTFLARGFFLISILLIIIGGMFDLIPSVRIHEINYGVLGTFILFFQALTGKVFIGWIFIGTLLFLLDVIALGASLSYVVIKSKKDFLTPAITMFFAVAYFSYLFILITSQIEKGIMTQGGMIISYFAVLFLCGSLFFLGKDFFRQMKEKEIEPDYPFPLKDVSVRDIMRNNVEIETKKQEEIKEERPVSKERSASPTRFQVENEIRGIIKREIEAIEKERINRIHNEIRKDNMINKKANIKMQKRETETKEVSSFEEEDKEDPFARFKSRRKLSFEKRLLESEESLRQHYYALRDYIKGYGVKNRVSKKGDTFSIHRKRYIFLTIAGKHIKAFFALDPKGYEQSTLPTKETIKKKYEDLPLHLDIRSGLSYRRALALVDDLMGKIGIKKWRSIH